MDKKEAKEILLRGRPWSGHKSTEEQAAAKLAETDPELAQLKSQQEEFNARVRRELAGIPVPNGLRDQILARRKIVRAPIWRRPRQLLALAASILVLSSTLFYLIRTRENTSFTGFRDRMVGFAVREYRMDLLTQNFAELNGFLAAKGRPSIFTLAGGLARTPLKGGASLSWQGIPVSMVCFDWTAGETLYMFVIDQSGPKPKGSLSAPHFEAVKGLTTASWTDGNKAFLLAGHIPANELANLLRL